MANDARAFDAGLDLLDELPGERDAGGDTLVIVQGCDSPLNDPAQVQGDAVSRLGGSKSSRSRLEPFSKLAETRREGLRYEDLVEAAVVPRHW